MSELKLRPPTVVYETACRQARAIAIDYGAIVIAGAKSTVRSALPDGRATVRIGLALVAVVAVTLLFGVTAGAQEISIRLDGDAFRVAGSAAGWKEPAQGWASIFRVYSGTGTGSGTGDVPPLAGSYAVEGSVLVFHPRFALVPGVRYRAIFQLPNGKPVEATFEKKRPQLASTTHVTHVYPSTDVLPSNTLKLYIYFSAPMSRGEAWQHIHLLDEKGVALKFEFVEIQQELWDPNNTRLTVLFDPGRIKRGVLPNEQLGPPIVEGKRYTLVIDRGWQDARGVPLEEEFRKAFRGGPADRTPPDPKTWRVSAPRAASSADLVVDFPKPMDFALLQRMIRVARARGGVRGAREDIGGAQDDSAGAHADIAGQQGNIVGTITVDRQETQWRFTPREPWKAGAYRLLVDTGIEDLSGNRIGQAFDLDKFQRVTKSIETQTIGLPFDIH